MQRIRQARLLVFLSAIFLLVLLQIDTCAAAHNRDEHDEHDLLNDNEEAIMPVSPNEERFISQLTSGASGLVWHDLSVHINKQTPLLHNCTGFVPNGHVCGVLGPSGKLRYCVTLLENMIARIAHCFFFLQAPARRH